MKAIVRNYSIAIVILGFFALVYYIADPVYQYKRGEIRHARDKFGKLMSVTQDISPDSKTIKKVLVPIDTPVETYDIVDTVSGRPIGPRYYSSSYENGSPNLLRWKNYIIGYSKEFYHNANAPEVGLMSIISSVRIYDISSERTFEVALPSSAIGMYATEIAQVVDDSYYMGLGGFFGPTVTYKLTLPPHQSSVIKQLPYALGHLNMRGPYLVESYCYEGCQYWILRGETRIKLSRLEAANNVYDWKRDEKFIGYDSVGRAIIHSSKGLLSFSLVDENSERKLLTPDKLPIPSQLYMIDGLDKVLIIGNDSQLIYNIKTNMITPIEIDVPPWLEIKNDTPHVTAKTQTDVCFTDAYNSNNNFAVNMEMEAQVQYPLSCSSERSDLSVEEAFKSLDMGSRYKLSKTEAIYKTYRVGSFPENKIPDGAIPY